MNTLKLRLENLRNTMRNQDIDACIIPGTDPHAGEYIADHWKEREWISGFDGSAGTVALTLEKAGVWVDSRYFLQADEQLEHTDFKAMKMGLPQVPDIIPWLIQELQPGQTVGVNALMFSVNAVMTVQASMLGAGIIY